MRYPDDHKPKIRERIIRAAAKRFRRRGGERATISDLMRDLRLTHGGFYRHFDSKEDLLAEAFGQGLRQVSDRLAAAAEHAAPGGELRAIIAEHCEDVANGCPVAALVSELSRHPGGARASFQRAVHAHIGRMARYVPGVTQDERERKASTLFSSMAGALAMARAIPDGPRRRRALDDARRFYLDAVCNTEGELAPRGTGPPSRGTSWAWSTSCTWSPRRPESRWRTRRRWRRCCACR
jgi:TetR/AcrR family transcriptional repressor of nem operon